MEFYIFFCGIFAGKIYYRHFCLFFTQNVDIDKKNTKKYIYDVKFPVILNSAFRIGLNIEVKPEIRIFVEKFIPQKKIF